VTDAGEFSEELDGVLIVGAWGEGVLNVEAGGRVNAVTLYVGGTETSEVAVGVDWGLGDPDGDGTVTVTGDGSILSILPSAEGEIPMTTYVGYSGEGTLNIFDGGRVESDVAVVGVLADGVGVVTVDGEGSTWAILGADVPHVGLTAEGQGDLTISNGGQVDVEGENALLLVADAITIGSEGEGSAMAISDGGQVASGSGIIGAGADATGTVTVAGDNSRWDMAESLVVGAYGEGTLEIGWGGQVTADEIFVGGFAPVPGLGDDIREYLDPDAELPTGTGTITISGAAVLQSEGLSVGLSGQGTLEIDNGAHVISEWAELGVLPDAVGVVQVDNGTWSITDSLVVGAYGQGDLAILDGTVVADEVYVGGAPLDFFVPSEEPYDPDLLPSGTGSITVSGSFGHLYVTGENTLYVGYSGTGTLNVDAGGDVTAESVVIGAAPDAEGTVLVTGAGSTLTTQDMTIGAWGEGELTIADGAEVTAEYVTIGGFDATDVDDLPQEVLDEFGDGLGTGVVTVMGDGSSLSVTGDFPLTVGYFGTGTLTASEGGLVESDSLMIGAAPDATGTVTVDDAELAIAGSTVIGGWGQGNLTVSGGSEASVGTLYIGGFDEDEAPSEWVEAFGDSLGTGIVAVTGAGSVLDVTEDNTIYVGYSGNGTMEILNGGQVNSHSGIVGVLDGGDGLVTVDGVGSLWQINGGEAAPDVLPQGEGEVIVSNGGMITVAGLNGLLSVADEIAIGSEGEGSSLTISDGADVYSDMGVIGGYNPEFEDLADYFDPNTEFSDGTGTVTVTGEGSRWENDYLAVGFSGDGELLIEDGGYVLDEVGMVGTLAGVTGVAEVTGEGSTWDNLSALVVGAWGTGELTISEGGQVYATDAYIGGMPLSVLEAEENPDYTPTGSGVVTVIGGDSELTVAAPASLYVGYTGDGELNILDGGYVESQSAAIGLLPGSTGSVLVDGFDPGEEIEMFEVLGDGGGTPSVWDNANRMVIGGYGDGLLGISGGGEVYSYDVYIGGFDPEGGLFDIEFPGYDPNGTGAVIVTDDGSLLETGALVVGVTGTGALGVLDGGQVNSEVGLIAFGPDSVGDVLVDGAGATWTLYNPDEEEEDLSILGVGIYGQGQMIISDGGQVTVADAVIGGFDLEDIGASNFEDRWGDPNGTGTVIVTGEGSLLDVAYDLCVGHSGVGNLFINSAGQVNSHDGYIGDEPNGVGTVVVSGESSLWDLLDDLYVGGYGTGTLTISDGGLVVVDDDAHIGYGESGNGAVVVTGENSTLLVYENLYVGGHDEGAGGLGSLFVNDGGQVTVWHEMYVWQTGLVGGDGTITVMSPTTLHNYGTIAPGDNGIGTLSVEGSVVFHEGSTFAVDINNTTSDRLAVYGDVTIEGGTVQVSSDGTIMGEHDYEIIRASSVVGEFNDLDTALLDFSVSEASLDYNDISVLLHIAAANFDDPNIARTDNQRAVGGALQDIGGQGGNDVTDALQDLETADDVRGAYDQLSGQTRPPLAPMTIAGSSKFLGTVTSRVQTVQTGLVAGAFDFSPLAAAGPDQVANGSSAQDPATRGQTFAVGNGSRTLAGKRWGLWGRGYGLFGDRDSEGGVPGYTYNIYGGSFGVDYQFSEGFLAGIVGGMSEGDADFRSSRDSTDFGAAHIGLYGSLARGPWFVDSVITFAGLDYETERFVDILDERLTGNFDGHEFAGYVEGSRSFDLNPKLRLAPLASLQYTYLSLDSYTETGGAAALAFDEQTHESIRGSLGARLTQRLVESAGDFRADLQVRGRWVHEFGDERSSVDSSFASDPTVVFTVRDEETSRDSAILGAGLSAQLSEKTKMYLDYDARLNSDETVQVISASLQYRW
jgi:T5SS/PEP-CTERM-associated repeat protein